MLEIGRDGLGLHTGRERRHEMSAAEIAAVVIAAAVVLALVW